MIAGIIATLVEMLSFDNTLGPMIDWRYMFDCNESYMVPVACTMPRRLINPSGLERRSNPLKVVRFQLKNNKMSEPKVPVRFDLDDREHEPKEKSLEEREGLKTVEGEVEVVRFKSS
ncbi:unnamed protein product [Brassica rapa]|uniref:Uncharacterized protein n=1 Tax=Brassica campestris TaxID=3711 RepID=A0A8D9D6Z6_BRACM|nr:unnamed protein product [Brassica rapa]